MNQLTDQVPSLHTHLVKQAVVLVRVDFNIPFNKTGKIKDDTRIVRSLPTLKHLLKSGNSLVLLSHHSDTDQSLRPLVSKIADLLEKEVTFIDEYWHESVIKQVNSAPKGSVFLCENSRFHEGEKKNDLRLANHLAQLADFYVNDAFGTAHRVHVSTVGVAEKLPGAIGFLMKDEVETIIRTIHKPRRPLVAIIGGGKITTKLGMIEKLLEKADTVLLGGCIANTLFHSWGIEVGKSLIEPSITEQARSIFWKASNRHTAMILPQDVVTAHATLRNGTYTVMYTEVHPDHAIYDIGSQTIAQFSSIIQEAGTVIWNGPLGWYEETDFSHGTKAITRAIAQSSAESLVGGGDTIANIEPELRDNISHISTGGGAMLELIEKDTLPALEVLRHT